MSGFTPFKKHANKFNYLPRYYDPEKEERDRRRPRPNWRDDDHEGRVRPDIPQAQKVVYDPIFDSPYDTNSAEVNDQPAAEEPVVRTPTTAKPAKKQPRVAALLGGLLRK